MPRDETLALIWPETLKRARRLSSRRLSCDLGDSHALSAALVHSRRLSCALGDSRAFSATLVRSRRLTCALGDSRLLSLTLVRSRLLSRGGTFDAFQFFLELIGDRTVALVWPRTLVHFHRLPCALKEFNSRQLSFLFAQ